jgi:hypothetical protein
LQQLVGAQENVGDQLLFFTGSNYSKTAIEYANERQIALFQYDPWGRMRPMNVVAVEIGALRSGPPAFMSGAGGVRVSNTLASSPLKRHISKHWSAWASAFFAVAPITNIGKPEARRSRAQPMGTALAYMRL